MQTIVLPLEDGSFPTPTCHQIEAVLSVLPSLEAIKESNSAQYQALAYISDDLLATLGDRIALSFYENGFVINFNWPAWRPTAERLLNDMKTLKSASMLEMQQLATSVVRQARFSDTAMITFAGGGYALAFLQRLHELHQFYCADPSLQLAD